MATVFPNVRGLFQQDDAPCLTADIVQEQFEEHDKEFKVLTWPPNSPDLNPIEHLWDVLDKQVRSMEAPPHNLQDLKGLLLTSWCQKPHTPSEVLWSPGLERDQSCFWRHKEELHNIRQITKGLKVTFDTSFSPNTGKKSGKVKTAYKCEYVNVGCDVDFDFSGPLVHAAAVLGYDSWLAGFQMTFDPTKSKTTRNNLAIGYRARDFQLHTHVNDGSEFGGSVYQKLSDNLETAVNLAWTAGSNNTRFGIAAKYALDSNSSVNVKVNNSSLVGVGYTQTLRPGVKLILSALVDGKSINAGGHKLGLGFELEA
ncbi:hypothetical protein PDJAM_G00040730 [Pangasius djambal]|uniref:Uncharacterized protein n=1 Tax=Pangasius djambal TaxID=1691987 RepID=A0ACC5YU59_9TELE|nr:hypothetical protein [Pangasius djambal]